MILRTTNVRLGRMIDAIPRLEGDPPLAFELALALLVELSQRTGGDKPTSRVQVEICYAAGVKMRELMTDACYKPESKAMRRGLSSSHIGALQDLATALNEEARHPALRGVGMAGHVARVFHVWGRGAGLWSPLPIPGIRFQILRPVWHVDDEAPSTKFTLWDVGGYSPPSRLDDEALHWRFVNP